MNYLNRQWALKHTFAQADVKFFHRVFLTFSLWNYIGNNETKQRHEIVLYIELTIRANESCVDCLPWMFPDIFVDTTSCEILTFREFFIVSSWREFLWETTRIDCIYNEYRREENVSHTEVLHVRICCNGEEMYPFMW